MLGKLGIKSVKSALATRAFTEAMAGKKALYVAKISRQHRAKRDYCMVAKLAFLLQESIREFDVS